MRLGEQVRHDRERADAICHDADVDGAILQLDRCTNRAPAVRASLERHPQSAVRDRAEFEGMTSHYWVIGSGAGATLAFHEALLGFIVGLVVVGQTLYSLTESRSRELATLKAMGASGRELAAFVLWQAGPSQ